MACLGHAGAPPRDGAAARRAHRRVAPAAAAPAARRRGQRVDVAAPEPEAPALEAIVEPRREAREAPVGRRAARGQEPAQRRAHDGRDERGGRRGPEALAVGGVERVEDARPLRRAEDVAQLRRQLAQPRLVAEVVAEVAPRPQAGQPEVRAHADDDGRRVALAHGGRRAAPRTATPASAGRAQTLPQPAPAGASEGAPRRAVKASVIICRLREAGAVP